MIAMWRCTRRAPMWVPLSLSPLSRSPEKAHSPLLLSAICAEVLAAFCGAFCAGLAVLLLCAGLLPAVQTCRTDLPRGCLRTCCPWWVHRCHALSLGLIPPLGLYAMCGLTLGPLWVDPYPKRKGAGSHVPMYPPCTQGT